MKKFISVKNKLNISVLKNRYCIFFENADQKTQDWEKEVVEHDVRHNYNETEIWLTLLITYPVYTLLYRCKLDFLQKILIV